MATKAQRLREAAKAAKLAAASAAKVADLDDDDDDDDAPELATSAETPTEDESENPKRIPEYAIVERLRDDGRFWECGRVSPPGLVTADYLGQKFGGGLFQVTSYGPSGKKIVKFGMTGKRTIRADPEVYVKKEAPGNGSPAMGTELLGFVVQQMSTLAASQQQQQQAFMSSQDMMQKMNLAVITTMLDSKKTDPGIMTLVAEMIRSKNEAATNPAEMFKLAADLIRKDGGGGGGGLKDKIEELSMLRDLMDGTDKDKTWLDVAADYAPMFERAIGAMTPRAEPAKALPASPDATVHTLPPTTNPDMNQELIGYVRQRLPKWAKKAEQGKDASLQADSFLDDVPVGVYPRLLDVLKRDDLLDQLAVLDARVGLYREWFGRFIARCVEVIDAHVAADDDDDDDE